MKREELTAAGLTDEQIDKVMKLNGDDINREKAKYSDYDDVKKQLEKALNDAANKGKSLDDLLKALTDGKTDIFKDDNAPTPPTVTTMTSPSNKDDDSAIRAVMGLK